MTRPARPDDPAQLALFDEPTAGAGIAAPMLERRADDRPASVYRHPRAEREVHLGEHRVAYEFRRARRRSIGFIVGADGLSVAAPRWIGQDEIDAALREKSGWILRKLAEQQERSRRLQASRVDWRDGISLPYLGEPLAIVLGAPVRGAELQALASGRQLHLGLAVDAAPAQIRDAVLGWLLQQARIVFDERCRFYAARLGVTMTSLRLSRAQTRWGSASVNGSVRLNWRLIHFGMATIDYVVVHELAHLRHMDHSPRFWAVVGSVIPDYQKVRSSLKEGVLPVFD